MDYGSDLRWAIDTVPALGADNFPPTSTSLRKRLSFRFQIHTAAYKNSDEESLLGPPVPSLRCFQSDNQ